MDLDVLYKQAGTLSLDIEILRAKLNETHLAIIKARATELPIQNQAEDSSA